MSNKRKKKTKKRTGKRLAVGGAALQKQLTQLSKQFKQAYAGGDFHTAMQYALAAHRLIPNSPTPLSDAATCAIGLENWQLAVDYAQKTLAQHPTHVNSLDCLSHAYGYLGDTAAVNRYGGQALALRDQPFAEQAKREAPPPVILDEQRIAQGKKIIAFSLYGGLSAYNEPAVMNAELQSRIYPDWQCRFYVDDSVPQQTISRLKAHQAQVIVVNEEQRQLPGTMWRFFALDDVTVGRVIFRDADSVISEREAIAVREWENSKQAFHLIRDAGSHTEVILAGLWGAAAGAVDNITAQMYDYVRKQGSKLSGRFADQFFLREKLWITVRDNAMTHSSLFTFMNANPLPPVNNVEYKGEHIGDDEGSSHFTAKSDYPEGTLIYWTLYSQLSPYIDVDGVQATEQEREICTYSAVQTNGQIQGNIPKRYSRGINKGLSRITIGIVE